MEAMRQRLLAQQLNLQSPRASLQDKGDNPSESNSPLTPQRPRLPIQTWKSEPRVKMLPFQQTPHTPVQQSPWSHTSLRNSQSRFLVETPTKMNETPTKPWRSKQMPVSTTPLQRKQTSSSATPLQSTQVSAIDRERQLQNMLSGIVSVMEDVDLNKARVEGLRCQLLPHQIQGVDWMQQRERGKRKGGILADDMGLGKTVQMLALILKHRHLEDVKGDEKKDEEEEKDPRIIRCYETVMASNTKTTLIIAPLAVIEQWQREATDKTAGKLSVFIHHGSQRAKTTTPFKKADIVITTYATAANEHSSFQNSKGIVAKAPSTRKNKAINSNDDAWLLSENDEEAPTQLAQKASKGTARYPLFEMNWLRIVLDEAQNIKNFRTKSSLACFELSLHAATRWCLSGTPLQNTALEIFSLLHFLRISPFDDLGHFQENIGELLKSPKQELVDIGMRRLSVVLHSVMLRRTKNAEYKGQKLLQLPKRVVKEVICNFATEDERDFYRDLEERIQDHMEGENDGDGISYISALLMLLRLRQACNHPMLVIGRASVEDAEPGMGIKVNDDVNSGDDLAAMLSGLSVKTRHCERCQAPLDANSKSLCDGCEKQQVQEKEMGVFWDTPGCRTTKLHMMLSLLAKFPRDDKVIIFSQFTSYLDLIEPVLKAEGILFVRYDGSMNRAARELALNKIRNHDATRVILISFKAGSTGLNLTCCNRVILCDLWWNPQIEEQAFDRAHRLGQTKEVYVYKLSIAGTVEERILELQKKKRMLAKSALEGTRLRKNMSKLDRDELRLLFGTNG